MFIYLLPDSSKYILLLYVYRVYIHIYIYISQAITTSTYVAIREKDSAFRENAVQP